VLSSSATPEVLSIQNLITVKKRSGLSAEKRVKRVPGGRPSLKATGRIRVRLGPDTSGYRYVVVLIDFIYLGWRWGSSVANWKLAIINLMDSDSEIIREELHQLV
jgi:hypothetical protein